MLVVASNHVLADAWRREVIWGRLIPTRKVPFECRIDAHAIMPQQVTLMFATVEVNETFGNTLIGSCSVIFCYLLLLSGAVF